MRPGQRARRRHGPWPALSSRAVLPTRVISTSKGSRRLAISWPIPPTPTSSTRRSASEERRCGCQLPVCWSRTAWSMPRSLAMIRPIASSAVAAACTPEALATAAAGPAASGTPSKPVDCVWTNLRLGACDSEPRTADASMYGRITASMASSAIPSGAERRSHTEASMPAGSGCTLARRSRSGKVTVRTVCIAKTCSVVVEPSGMSVSVIRGSR